MPRASPAVLALALLGTLTHFSPRDEAFDTTSLLPVAAALERERMGPGWCRTVLFGTSPPFEPAMLRLPPGTGLSVTINPDRLKAPLRSRYVFLDREVAPGVRPKAPGVTPMVTLPTGTLYRDPASNCGAP